MKNITYCILTAGLGSRFKPLSNFANKALAPAPFEPIISKLIDKIPKDAQIYVCTGYLGDDLAKVIEIQHKNRNINYVCNSEYATTGMGDSLLKVLEKCSGEIVVVPNDGIYTNNIDSIVNDTYDIVMGVSSDSTVKGNYLKIAADPNGNIFSYSRGSHAIKDDADHKYIFTGLMYIKDSQRFKKILHTFPCPREIYNPISSYIEESARCIVSPQSWLDCGTYEKYKDYLSRVTAYDFSKTEELLLLKPGTPVVKIFSDKSIALKRVEKSAFYSKAFPKCTFLPSKSGYFYSFLKGNTLYDSCSLLSLKNLLRFMNTNLWNIKKNIDIRREAQKFYRDKTLSRIKLLEKRYQMNNFSSVNGKPLKSDNIIPQFDFSNFVEAAIASPIHGDLQYDNCLISQTGKISLIDWRHEFGGNVYYGDIYYDLAKLLGGILLNYKRIKKNEFTCYYDARDGSLKYEYISDDYVDDHIHCLKEFISDMGLDFNHCYKLLSLIYLNMSPLHEPPFDLLLLSLSHELYYH